MRVGALRKRRKTSSQGSFHRKVRHEQEKKAPGVAILLKYS